MTRDPIGYNGGANLYGFAGNNPVNRTDPNGTNAFTEWWHQHVTTPLARMAFGRFDSPITHANHGVPELYDIDGIQQQDQLGKQVGRGFATGMVAGAAIYATAAAGAVTGPEAGSAGEITPWCVRFTQKGCNWNFGGAIKVRGIIMRNIQELVANLRSGAVTAKDIDPIRLVIKDGKVWSLDNRRLEAFRRAGVNIRYRLATQQEIDKIWPAHYDGGEGLSIDVRGEPK